VVIISFKSHAFSVQQLIKPLGKNIYGPHILGLNIRQSYYLSCHTYTAGKGLFFVILGHDVDSVHPAVLPGKGVVHLAVLEVAKDGVSKVLRRTEFTNL
jgi:hypothetical protein